MKRAVLKYQMSALPREKLDRLREIERDFHVRAFGEELARVNLDMNETQRRAYLSWMRDNARRNGISYARPLPYGFSENEDTL